MRIIDPTQDGPQAVLPSNTAGQAGYSPLARPGTVPPPMRGVGNGPAGPVMNTPGGLQGMGVAQPGSVAPRPGGVGPHGGHGGPHHPRRTPVMVRPPSTGGGVVPNPGPPMSGPGSPGGGDGGGMMAANGVNAGELGPLWSDTFV